MVDSVQRFDDSQIRLRGDLTRDEWQFLIADAGQRLCLPEVNKKALDGLKFSEALPERLALATLASRLAGLDGATAVLMQPTRFVRTPSQSFPSDARPSPARLRLTSKTVSRRREGDERSG